MKRAAIFVIYDKDGVVDRSVDYYLSHLSPFLSRLLIVVNGELSEEGRKVLSQYTDEIIVRENIGYDTGAFQAGIRAIGYDVLKTYDELLVLNDSVFGPVYPLEEMFTAMEKRPELSFWGVTGHRRRETIRWKDNPCGYMEAHIQSYFTAFRKALLSDTCFREYWEALPLMKDRQQAIERHETYATYYFAQHGFRWDCYVPMAEKNESEDMAHGETLRAMAEYRLPLIKKNLYGSSAMVTPGLRESVYHFIKEKTAYDANIIAETVARKLSDEELITAIERLSASKTLVGAMLTKLFYGWHRVKKWLKKSRLLRTIWDRIKSE